MAGWIKVWDIPEDHWLNSDIRYFGMWIKLIRKAETRDRKLVRNGVMIEAKRGTVYSSVNKMAEEWGVTRRTVDHFLALCEADGMITVQRAGNAGSNVIINNYAKYQDKPNNKRATDNTTNDTTDGTTDSTTDGTTKATLFLTNKSEYTEGQKGGEDNVRAQRFTPPTITDIVSFAFDENLKIDADRFYDYYSSNGWMVGRNKMKDWKAAVRNWARKDALADKARTEPNPKKFNNFEQRLTDNDVWAQLEQKAEEDRRQMYG